MVDFHSHILPGVDDGSKSVEESLGMVNMLASQGVSVIAATPHFYADNETVTAFVQRRDDALAKLAAALPANSPTVLAGAELSYYEGISRLENLLKLRLDNTKLLLMEMPMAKWGKSSVKEIISLACRPDITLVIAHCERYLHYQSEQVVNELLQNDVLFQTNASLYLRLLDRGGAVKNLKNGVFHLIGSDCHNTTTRQPRMAEAFAYIQKKLGSSFVDELNGFSYNLINN